MTILVDTLVLTSVVMLGVVAAPRAVAATTLTNPPSAPLTCVTSTAWLSQNNGTSPPTTLYQEQFGAGSVTFSSVGTAPNVYNALAYNAVSGYLYAIDANSFDVLRVDPTTGAVTDLGPTVPAMGGTVKNTGAFDAAGNYYVAATGTTSLSVIDANTLTRTTVTLTVQSGAADLTYVGGYLWGATGSHAPADRIVRIDPATGTVTYFPAPAGLPSGAADGYGGAFTYGNGNIGLSDNNGGLYQVSITNQSSATPTFTLVSKSTSPSSPGNDAASCTSPPTDLQIVKTGPPTVQPGGPVTWQLRVTNSGPASSSGFTVTDDIPAGYTAVTATPGCMVTGNAITCTSGFLAVGASTVITVTATALTSTTPQCLTNTATVLGNEADPVSSNDTSSLRTCIGPAPVIVSTGGLWIDMTVNKESAAYGDTLSYTTKARNIGGATATKVPATIVLPPGTAFVSSTGAVSLSGNTLHWVIPTLAPSASVFVTITVSIEADVGPETLTGSFGITNPVGFAQVVVVDLCATAATRSCASTDVAAASAAQALVFRKQVESTRGSGVWVDGASPYGQPASYVPGQLVAWRFIVTNASDSLLTDIAVSDLQATRCSTRIASLPPRVTATITCFTIASTSLTNIATVAATIHTQPSATPNTAMTSSASNRITAIASARLAVTERASGLAVTGAEPRSQLMLTGLLCVAGLLLVRSGSRRRR